MGMRTGYRLRTLGSPALLTEDGSVVDFPIGKPFALLVRLALEPEGVERAALARLLWGRAEPARARQSLRQALSLIRRSLGDDLFESEDPVRLAPGRVSVDVHQVEALLDRGQVEAALAVYDGGFLDDVALTDAPQWDEWAGAVRDGLVDRLAAGAGDAARARAAAGDPAGAVVLLDLALDAAPFAFGLVELRIRVLLDAGRAAEAAEAVAEARRRFDEPEEAAALAALESEAAALRVEAAQAAGAGAGDGGFELVGRAAELARLMALWREARKGRPCVVTVTGAAGIGKTRLVRELERAVRSEPESPAVVVWVKASPAERRMRWSVAGELVRRLLLLPGAAGISGASDRLLRSMVPSLAGEAEGPPPGVPAVALADAVRDLVSAVSYEGPLLLAMDDWQWADRESAALLGRVARQLERDPALMVLTRRSGAATDVPEGVELELAPLTRADVEEMLALAGLAGPADELAARLHAASEGNPLFLVELLRALLDDGVLVRTEDGMAVAPAGLPDPLPVPKFVLTLLDRRLDGLTPLAEEVLAALARESRPSTAGRLRERTGRGDAEVRAAAAEAVDRQVAHWVDEERLDFTHDQLRLAAIQRFAPLRVGPVRRRRLTRRARVAAAVAGAALVMVVGYLVASATGGRETSPARYGGGSILLVVDSFYKLRPTGGAPEGWSAAALGASVAGARAVPVRAAPGELRWYRHQNFPDRGPDVVEYRPGEPPRTVLGSPGDVAVSDVSSDGRRFLLLRERLDHPTFAHELVFLDEGEDRLRVLYRGADHIHFARWSADEDRIAMILRGAVDTVAILSSYGHELRRTTFDGARSLAWCGNAVAVVTGADGRSAAAGHIHVMDPRTGNVMDLGHTDILPLPVRCSPDGSALLHRRVVDGRPAAAILDLATDSVHILPLPETGSLHWVPDRPRPVPRGLDLSPRIARLERGERRQATGALVLSDGTRRDATLRWRALDPAVVSVTADGVLSANRPGTGRVVAGWGASIRDTITVRVTGDEPRDAWLHEDFDRLDPELWIGFGAPRPVPDTVDGAPVLRITGDEKYQDGIMLRPPVDLGRGATVELEFRVRLTRPVHQSVTLCLADIRDDYDPAVLEQVHPPTLQQACLRYPAEDLAKFDPSTIGLGSSVYRPVRLPRVLPRDGWVHAAIQISPAGEVSLVVEREVVATDPVRVDPRPAGAWRVLLFGRAVGTDVFVRDLAVWEGPRY
jgi:DNA-binding SARP family transcriptional activator